VEAEPQRLLLFGVRPDYPATGFGYIERGQPFEQDDRVFEVASFREKPDTDVARQYVDAGRYYWNCGIFVWKAARILELIEEYEPAIHDRLQTLKHEIHTPQWSSALEREFPAMTSISIDYAVLERAQGVCVMEAPFDWDDVGSWHALARLLGEDEHGNTLDGNVCQVDSRGCIVRCPDKHLIATAGVENLIIVHTPDVTLVASKDDENAVRNLVAELESRGLTQYL
jgi:mannose-1-phosphate guanylyltransferase